MGEIREWKHSYTPNDLKFKVIKTEEGFVHYAPWLYRKHFGEIPEGFIIGFKDRDNMNVVPENLELIDRAEHARRNGRNRSYPKEIRELERELIIFNNTLKQMQDGTGAS